MSKENTTADTARAAKAQVDRDSLTHVGRQRQLRPALKIVIQGTQHYAESIYDRLPAGARPPRSFGIVLHSA
jgi:hypothetical protein